MKKTSAHSAGADAAGVASEGGVFMAKRVLISIDWDYFIDCGGLGTISLKENYANIYLRWYMEYIQNPGFVFSYGIHPGLDVFWRILKQRYSGEPCLWISESHKYSYHLCRSLHCRRIISFDAHSDLGYGSMSWGMGHIHCANWLAQLLQWRELEEAQVVLSPYSLEKPDDFGYGKVSFCSMNDLLLGEDETVAGIHICRSGAWTPPWYDAQLTHFIELSENKNVKGTLRERTWKPAMLDYPQLLERMFLMNASHAS